MFSIFKKKQESVKTPKKESVPESIPDNATPFEKALFAYKKGRIDEVLSLMSANLTPEGKYLTELARWKKYGVISGSSLNPIIIKNPADPVLSPLLKAEIPAMLKRMQAEAKMMGKNLKVKDLQHGNEGRKQKAALQDFITVTAFLYSKEQFEQCKAIVAPFEDLLWQLNLEYGYASDEPECVKYIKEHINRFRGRGIPLVWEDPEKILEIFNRHPELDAAKEIDIITRLFALYKGKKLLRGEHREEGLKLLEDSFSPEVREAASELEMYYSDKQSDHYDEMKSKYWTYLRMGGNPAVPMESAVMRDHIQANELLPNFTLEVAQSARLSGTDDLNAEDEAAYVKFAEDQECGEAGSMLLYATANFEKAEGIADTARVRKELYKAYGDKWLERSRAKLAEDDQAFAKHKRFLSIHKESFYEAGRKMCGSNNPKEAFVYFKAAADCGQFDAILGLIYCYAKGYGTEKNLEQASRYSGVLKETRNLRFTLGEELLFLRDRTEKNIYHRWVEIGREGSRLLLLQSEISRIGFFKGQQGTSNLIKEAFAIPFICERIVKDPDSRRMENNPFFYLSVEEAIRYLGPLEEKKGMLKNRQVLSNPNAIVRAQKEALGNFPSGASDWTFSWWLRDRGAGYPMYCNVNQDGVLDTNGTHEENDCGDRYAFWIDLDWFLHEGKE